MWVCVSKLCQTTAFPVYWGVLVLTLPGRKDERQISFRKLRVVCQYIDSQRTSLPLKIHQIWGQNHFVSLQASICFGYVPS